MTTIAFKVRVSWWVKPYIRAVGVFCAITGLQPDTDKISQTVMRGMRLEVK